MRMASKGPIRQRSSCHNHRKLSTRQDELESFAIHRPNRTSPPPGCRSVRGRKIESELDVDKKSREVLLYPVTAS